MTNDYVRTLALSPQGRVDVLSCQIGNFTPTFRIRKRKSSFFIWILSFL